jgi:glutathione S-transferase
MGRGEAIRLAFYLAGLPLKEIRVPFEQWEVYKGKTPFGRIPVLNVDDSLVYTQSNSILRYAGKLTGLYPTNDLEALRVDQIMDSVEDAQITLMKFRKEQDPEKKKQLGLKQAAPDSSLSLWFKATEKILEDTGCNPYVTGTLTIADLKLATFIHRLKNLPPLPITIADSYKHCMAIYTAIMSHPKIKEWYDTKAWEKNVIPFEL